MLAIGFLLALAQPAEAADRYWVKGAVSSGLVGYWKLNSSANDLAGTNNGTVLEELR